MVLPLEVEVCVECQMDLRCNGETWTAILAVDSFYTTYQSGEESKALKYMQVAHCCQVNIYGRRGYP